LVRQEQYKMLTSVSPILHHTSATMYISQKKIFVVKQLRDCYRKKH